MRNSLYKYKTLAILAAVIIVSVQSLNADNKTVNGITMQYDKTEDGGIKVVNVWNKTEKRITLYLDDESVTINGNSSVKLEKYAKNVRFESAITNGRLWDYVPPQKETPAEQTETPQATEDEAVKKNDNPATIQYVPNHEPAAKTKADVSYIELLNQDPYFGQEAVNLYVRRVDGLCKNLSITINKSQFIIDNDIAIFLEKSKSELNSKRLEIPYIAQEIVGKTKLDASDHDAMTDLITETLNNRLRVREDAYDRLRSIVSTVDSGNNAISYKFEDNINYVITAGIVLIIIILTITAIRRKNKRKTNLYRAAPVKVAKQAANDNNPAIVVRRKTTSVLKKQCIDDVVDNPSYMVINTSEFTTDSAVHKIYIKNTCIKGIYDLYAENLRIQDNPKEDGCMILGRWVHNENNHTYDISLEDIVFPGDDAVFKEYELNFGGKIKLRIAEKLRKLRKETDLQYDLVCWVHSHPGLGVFFSNSDNNVQMQLKHSQHPNFLIAFVVDILTSNQEMGIFTFRKDGTMNSKGDITKMYSLDEMHKWALQSERNSFLPESYYNVLNNAKLKMPSCKGVELNNNSIIDLTQILTEPNSGFIGWAVGSVVEYGGTQEFIVTSIVKETEKPATGIIGGLISTTYMSIPTIQRLIVKELGRLSFVMVYSSKQANITTIPVINGELLTDEHFNGDVTIDELKIWTRRKR